VRLELGRVSGIFRYPIKSMAGTRLDSARIGWHGVEGDRRLAFRRLAERGPFPWLTASRLPELLLYQPVYQSLGRQETTGEPLPTHVRTPAGKEYALTDAALVKEIAARHAADLELMHLKHGIFDEAVISAITLGTIRGIGREAGHDLDMRRFRPNVVIDSQTAEPFEEDRWVGKVLEFGTDGTGPAISVTMRDPRCVMINFDPDTAAANASIMQTVIRMNNNHAGVYGTVVRTGALSIGQVVGLRT
jgi:MOSC domain-containing protein